MQNGWRIRGFADGPARGNKLFTDGRGVLRDRVKSTLRITKVIVKSAKQGGWFET